MPARELSEECFFREARTIGVVLRSEKRVFRLQRSAAPFNLFPVSTMKFVLRTFFKTLRAVLGPLLLLGEFLSRPKGLRRPPAVQEAVDRQCRDIVLYQYATCPFCIKVRQEMRRLSLGVERRDAQQAGVNRDTLAHGGGQTKVPCLKITDQAGNSEWMYESGAIVAYLRGRFAA